MENWININQIRSYEWKLSSNEEKICAFYAKKNEWVTSRIADQNGDFLNICLSKLMQELPTLAKDKATFSRTINKLVDKGVFEKRVNHLNKKEVFYRFNPVYLKAWKDNSLIIYSSLEDKSLKIAKEDKLQGIAEMQQGIVEMQQGIVEMQQGIVEMQQSVAEMQTINKTTNKQQINNINNIIDKTSSFKIKEMQKEKQSRDEFERLLKEYPDSPHNTPKKIEEAFKLYKSLDNVQRFNVLKALNNYKKTKEANSTTHRKFIKGIYNFILKAYEDFVYGVPENYEVIEEFKPKIFEMGGGCEIKQERGIDSKRREKEKFYISKFDTIQEEMKELGRTEDDDNITKKYLDVDDFRVFTQEMGGFANLRRYGSYKMAESMVDYLDNLEKVVDE